MNNFRKFNLLQVDENQGYIENGFDNYKYDLSAKQWLFDTKKYPSNTNWCLDEIIVKPSLNPFFVKEVLTGIEIPVLLCFRRDYYTDKQAGPELNSKCSAWGPYERTHTFVRCLSFTNEHLKQGVLLDNAYNKTLSIINGEKPTYEEAKAYKVKHSDKEAWKSQLESYLEQGKQKMENKLESGKGLSPKEVKRRYRALRSEVNGLYKS